MAIIDNKLTALNRGNALNSTGSNVATAVNEDIDELIILLENSMTNRTDIENLQTVTAGHTTSIATNASNISDLQTLTATQTSQLNVLIDDFDNIAEEWSTLTGSKDYDMEAYYRGDKYIIRNPVEDVTVAPPDRLNRTYFEFDGTNDYVTIQTVSLQSGDVITFNFRAPTETSLMYLLDHDSGSDRVQIALEADGTYLFPTGMTITVDGQDITTSSEYPLDGLMHTMVITLSSSKNFSRVGADFSGANFYKGNITNVVVTRGSTTLRSYPLRSDAVDYVAGNLVKDEEYTWEENASSLSGNLAYVNNTIEGSSGTAFFNDIITETGTYRVLQDYNFSSGGMGYNRGFTTNSALPTSSNPTSGSGTLDNIVVVTSVINTQFNAVFVGTGNISNWRVIEMDELSPSADFTNPTDFNTSGGVTISGGQAVFGSGTGTKQLWFDYATEANATYRVSYTTTGTTTGRFRTQFNTADGAQGYQTADGSFDVMLTSTQTQTGFYITTDNGWNGNVTSWSVTLVTDGTETGTILKDRRNYWTDVSLDNSEPRSAGVLSFGNNYYIDEANTLEIQSLSGVPRGKTLTVSREGTVEPVITLSATDITAGKRLIVGGSPVTTITIDDDVETSFYYNGTNVEVKT